MFVRLCPRCHYEACRWSEARRPYAQSNFCKCGNCGYIWSVQALVHRRVTSRVSHRRKSA